MREELKQYADEAYGIVETAANDIGSRLPGSENERKFADFMADKLQAIGIKPVKEKFLVAPRASIGGIPYAGWVGIGASILMLFPAASFNGIVQGLFVGLHGLAFFACLATLIWLVCSVFLYKTWFDFAFKQQPSQNVYGEVLPEDGKYDYTIMVSGHTDTSWNWKHSAATKNAKGGPVPVFIKMGIGILAFLFLFICSAVIFFGELALVTQLDLAYALGEEGAELTGMEVKELYDLAMGLSDLSVALYILIPLFVIPGCFMITMWADKNPRTASPGAMDNATGIAIAYAVTKYYKENPDKMPKGCRIIDFNCGSEEAGLRGSIDFTRRHAGEDILKNCWNINIDSIADKDHFQVVHGDVWQFTHFDPTLEKLLTESMIDAGIEKPGNIANPVGGCDSTPFTKAGVKSITFAAQNPTLTHYYHTFYDVPERFEKETVGMGIDVVLRLIDKIAAHEEAVKNGTYVPDSAPVTDAKTADAVAEQSDEAPVAETAPVVSTAPAAEDAAPMEMPVELSVDDEK